MRGIWGRISKMQNIWEYGIINVRAVDRRGGETGLGERGSVSVSQDAHEILDGLNIAEPVRATLACSGSWWRL